MRVVEERQALLDGAAIPASGVLVQSGQLIQIGGVQLCFHDTASLLAWLTRK